MLPLVAVREGSEPWQTWRSSGEEPVPGNSMLVEFTLTREGAERTRLRVTESGHELLGWAGAEKERYAAEHRDGWVEFLDRLARVITKRPSP